jgi:transcriptional regulator with XRE-family HTH domain
MGREGQVSALALFSEELRRPRSAAGLTQDQLAERVGYSPSLVAHVETGSRAPSLDFARRGDEALGTGGILARLQPFVRSEAYPAWFRDWVEIEREAVSLRWFEPLLIPGLLQTEEYARAVLAAAHPASPEDEVERLVSARMDRQAILDQAEPPLLWVILDEGVADPAGGRPGRDARPDRAAGQGGPAAPDCAPGRAGRCWRACGAGGPVRDRQFRRAA